MIQNKLVRGGRKFSEQPDILLAITNSLIRCDCSWLCIQCPEWTADKIDQFSAMAFPLVFLIFNIWYWFFFLGRLIT
uniref:Uncharacterized protein n=1 Tax=Ditylenchus dipsaci TaxID=166011 RepID=A0A915DR63_9BILA